MNQVVKRGLLKEALELFDFMPVLEIQGARQVGKSTLAHMIGDGREFIYRSLDDKAQLALAENDHAEFVNVPEGAILAVDEIQKLPQLSLAVKMSVDASRVPGKFIITDSSDYMRAAGHKDSLAGRAAGIKVYPLSIGERRGFLDTAPFVDRVLDGGFSYHDKPADTVSKQELARLIEVGGFPAVQELSERKRVRWFGEYLSDVVGFDALDRKVEKWPDRLQATLRTLAAHNAQELVKATVAREAEVPASSISTYLNILHTHFLVEFIPTYSRNLAQREKRKLKISLIDTGFASFLTGQSAKTWLDPAHPSPHFGRFVEAALIQELMAQAGWSEEIQSFYHWRDREGNAVDFIVELRDGRGIAFQFTSGTVKREHFKPLELIEDKLGDKFVGGFVVCRQEYVMKWGEKLYSIPWASLWS